MCFADEKVSEEANSAVLLQSEHARIAKKHILAYASRLDIVLGTASPAFQTESLCIRNESFTSKAR